MPKNDLFVNSVDSLSFGDEFSIPTAIRYSKESGPIIGFDAIYGSAAGAIVNDNFKIALGQIRPGSSAQSRSRFKSDDGESRSAYEIAKDFFGVVIKQIDDCMAGRGLEPAGQALVSEPLSFYVDGYEDWLPNYRSNLMRLLKWRYQSVEFLPEPFAVYQYYRYGLKHPLVGESKKYFALVIDFGGGTFDVSVIETTRFGDIAIKGRHARPIGAHSRPFGGFELNKRIAEFLVKRHMPSGDSIELSKKCIRNHQRWQDGELDIEDLNQRNRIFIRWYDEFLRQVERKKIELSRSIVSWDLESPIVQSVIFDVPEDPFREDSAEVTIRLTGEELREIVVSEVWPKELKPTVKAAFKNASDGLGHNALHVALMSGGSANLRWLEPLLRKDFEDALEGTEVVSLQESYQEVVAKGLAIECARRGYEEGSEFVDVTYNPLFLVLNPDSRGEERKRFRLIEGLDGIDPPASPAELLTSATALSGLEEVSLKWKTRLDHPPKQHLLYYFLKDPGETGDLENRYNIVQFDLSTAKGTVFESQTKVRLNLREDGTCTPEFIYKTGRGGATIHSEIGEPFYLDATTGAAASRRSASVGIDFGSSTSAVSYVDWKHIQLIERRSSDQLWLKINELVNLPYPASIAMKQYMGARENEMAARGLEALESILAFIVYLLWAEVSSQRPDKKYRNFGGGYKRSAGPLNAVLVQLLRSAGGSEIGRRIKKKLTADILGKLDDAINALNKEKHQKSRPGAYDPTEILEVLGNALRAGMDGFFFGRFEEVQKVGFGAEHKGVFRIANGSPPFHEKLQYSGTHSFSEQEAFIVSPAESIAISLTPLIYWELVNNEFGLADQCYVFDREVDAESYEYKQCGGMHGKRIERGSPLMSYLAALSDGSASAEKYEGAKLVADREY